MTHKTFMVREFSGPESKASIADWVRAAGLSIQRFVSGGNLDAEPVYAHGKGLDE